MKMVKWSVMLLIMLLSVIFGLHTHRLTTKMIIELPRRADTEALGSNYHVLIEFKEEHDLSVINAVENLPHHTLFKSKYAPFLVIETVHLNRSTLREIRRLSLDESIYRIYIHPNQHHLMQPDYYEPGQERTIDAVKGGDQTYGIIKMGVFETKSTTLDLFNPMFSRLRKIVIHPSSPIHYNPHDIYHRHATHVAATLVQSFGNNPNLELYFANINLGFFQGIEWFIEEGVDVLNMSFNTSNSNDGAYTAHSRYLDYLSYHHPIIFVTAAGNRGQTTQFVGGTAFNIMTVGALTSSSSQWLDLASFSSFSLAGDVVNSKPNLTALGFSYNSQWIGTSFAAPRVAGVIGQWMSYYPELKADRATLFSILHTASTTKNLVRPYREFDSSGLENRIGAGQLDALYGHAIIQQGQYQSVRWVNQIYFYPKEIYRATVYLRQNETLRVTVATLIEVRYDQGQMGSFSINDLKIRLLYQNYQVISTIGQTNIEMLVFQANQTGFYDVVVTLERPLYNQRAYDHIGISYRTTSKE